MKYIITEEDKHHLVAFSETEMSLEAVNELFVQLNQIDPDNIIIDLSKTENIESETLSELNTFAETWKQKNRSFLGFGLMEKYLVEDSFKFEIVPTLTEAQDILFMEIIERELEL